MRVAAPAGSVGRRTWCGTPTIGQVTTVPVAPVDTATTSPASPRWATRSSPTRSTPRCSTPGRRPRSSRTRARHRAGEQQLRRSATPCRIYNLLAHGPARSSRCRCTRRCCPIVEGVLDAGCLISSLSSIAIDPGEIGATDPRRRPAHPDPQAAPADGVQHDVGAHRLHRGERRHPARARLPPAPTTPPTTARRTTRSPPRWRRAACWSGTAACGTAAAPTRTDERRVGIAMNYCAGYIRQQENQQLGIPLEVARRFPPRLRELVRLRHLQRADRPHRQAPTGRRGARPCSRRPTDGGSGSNGLVWDDADIPPGTDRRREPARAHRRLAGGQRRRRRR